MRETNAAVIMKKKVKKEELEVKRVDLIKEFFTKFCCNK